MHRNSDAPPSRPANHQAVAAIADVPHAAPAAHLSAPSAPSLCRKRPGWFRFAASKKFAPRTTGLYRAKQPINHAKVRALRDLAGSPGRSIGSCRRYENSPSYSVDAFVQRLAAQRHAAPASFFPLGLGRRGVVSNPTAKCLGGGGMLRRS
jgi:hypothetical protein